MSTINQFRINGVIDTSQNVLSNMILLAQSSGCWVTYDAGTGKWSVILKQPGTSVKSFDDSNMIGEINISSSGINEIFNIAEVTFPNKDLDNTTDYVLATIPDADRFQNELDQKLTINFSTINNGAQAQLIAAHDLKQSRFDKVVDFKTDYTSLGEVKAGDIIDITSSMYGFDQKLFRIIQVTETDTDDGQLIISISASEYDSSIYDTSGLIIENRSKANGIPPKITNNELQAADQTADENNLRNLLLATLGSSFFNMLSDYANGSLGGNPDGGGTTPPVDEPIACEGTSLGLGRAAYEAPPAAPELTDCGGVNSYYTEPESVNESVNLPPTLPALNLPRTVELGDTEYINSDNDVYTVKIKPSAGRVVMDMSRYGSDTGATLWAPTSVKGYTKAIPPTIGTNYTVTSNTFNNSDPNLVTQIQVSVINSGSITPSNSTVNSLGEIIISDATDSISGSKVYAYSSITTIKENVSTTPGALTHRVTTIYAVSARHGTLGSLPSTTVTLKVIPNPTRFTGYKVTGNPEVPLEVVGSYNFINSFLGSTNYTLDSSSLPATQTTSRSPITLEYQLLVNGEPRGEPQIVTIAYKNREDWDNPYRISVL